MNKNIKNTLEASNGITLIALVVTIIVLLILAGISISMLSGDNGILQKAVDAKENTEKQAIIEQAKIDILGCQAENKGRDLDKTQLKSILETYFKDIPKADDLPNNISKTNDIELKTIDGKYTINLSEIFVGNLSNVNSTKISLSINNEEGDSDAGAFTISYIEGQTWRQWAESTSEPVYTDTERKFCGYFGGSLQDIILCRQNPNFFEVDYFTDGRIALFYGATEVSLNISGRGYVRQDDVINSDENYVLISYED